MYVVGKQAVLRAASLPRALPEPNQRLCILPCRTSALRQRHAAQLRQTDRDQHGVPVASSARPFSLWASPLKIAEASTGVRAHAGLACSTPALLSLPCRPPAPLPACLPASLERTPACLLCARLRVCCVHASVFAVCTPACLLCARLRVCCVSLSSLPPCSNAYVTAHLACLQAWESTL